MWGNRFTEGNPADSRDDVASFSFGSKEVYRLKYISTRTHVAKFNCSPRTYDGFAISNLDAAAESDRRTLAEDDAEEEMATDADMDLHAELEAQEMDKGEVDAARARCEQGGFCSTLREREKDVDDTAIDDTEVGSCFWLRSEVKDALRRDDDAADRTRRHDGPASTF